MRAWSDRGRPGRTSADRVRSRPLVGASRSDRGCRVSTVLVRSPARRKSRAGVNVSTRRPMTPRLSPGRNVQQAADAGPTSCRRGRSNTRRCDAFDARQARSRVCRESAGSWDRRRAGSNPRHSAESPAHRSAAHSRPVGR